MTHRKSQLVLILWLALGLAPSRAADALRASAADLAILKQLLADATSWDRKGAERFDEATRKQQEALAAKLGDAVLRTRTQKLLPEIETAAVRQARTRLFLKEVAAVK